VFISKLFWSMTKKTAI